MSHYSKSLGKVERLVFPVLSGAILFVLLRWLMLSEGLLAVAIDPAVIAGLGWMVQLFYVGYYGMEQPRSIEEKLRIVWAANLITIIRGLLYAIVAGFVVVPPETELRWVPVVAYGTGVVFDKLDGTVARRLDQETRLGKRLDMAFDTFGFLSAGFLGVIWGQLPVWYLSVALAKYVYKAGLWVHQLRGKKLHTPPESLLRRYLAGSQMVFLTIALTPIVPTALVWTAAPFVLTPFLLVFGRDYLIAIGRLPLNGNTRVQLQRLFRFR